VEHRPQTTRLRPALSCAAASIFLQLYLYPAVHISFSRSLFQVCLGRPLSLWPCSVHCSACLVTLSSFFLTVYPSQFHLLLRVWFTWPSKNHMGCRWLLNSIVCCLWCRELRVIFPDFVIPTISQTRLRPEKHPRTLALIRPDALENFRGMTACME